MKKAKRILLFLFLVISKTPMSVWKSLKSICEDWADMWDDAGESVND